MEFSNEELRLILLSLISQAEFSLEDDRYNKLWDLAERIKNVLETRENTIYTLDTERNIK